MWFSRPAIVLGGLRGGRNAGLSCTSAGLSAQSPRLPRCGGARTAVGADLLAFVPPSGPSRGPADRVLTHAGCMLDLEMKGLRARPRDRLLELDEVERRLKPFGRRYLGVREIPLDALVGTDSRASAFTRDFRPLHAFSRDRLRSLEEAFADGAFPPIVTVKLGEAYFVIDGHHRAALARRGGGEMIDADVTELIARVPLPAGADML